MQNASSDGSIESVGAQQDAVARLQSDALDVGPGRFGMSGKEAPGQHLAAVHVHLVVFCLVDKSVARPLHVASAVAHVGYGDAVGLYACHHQCGAHFGDSLFGSLAVHGGTRLTACFQHFLRAVGQSGMLFPVVRNAVAHRQTGHFATGMTAHPVTYDACQPLGFGTVHDEQIVFVVAPCSLLTDGRKACSHALLCCVVYSVRLTKLMSFTGNAQIKC